MILRSFVIAFLIAAFLLAAPGVSLGQEEDADLQEISPTPSPPVPGQPSGERNPYIGLIAAIAILVVGVAGIFIYRSIRKGL